MAERNYPLLAMDGHEVLNTQQILPVWIGCIGAISWNIDL